MILHQPKTVDRFGAEHTNQSLLQVGKAFRPGRHLGQTYSQGDLRTSKKLEPNSKAGKNDTH